jgi:hypothetical protein
MDAQTFHLWLEFEHWLPQGADLEDDAFNMQVTLAGGRKYALNVWTFKFFPRAVREVQQTGEHLQGSYLPPPDLFVERLDRALIERVVADLIAHGGLREEWEVHERPDDP